MGRDSEQVVSDSHLYVVLLFCDFGNTHKQADRHIHNSQHLDWKKNILELWVDFIIYILRKIGYVT